MSNRLSNSSHKSDEVQFDMFNSVNRESLESYNSIDKQNKNNVWVEDVPRVDFMMESNNIIVK